MDIVAPAKKRGFSFDGFSAWMLALAVPLAIVFFIPSTTVPLISTKIGILVLAVALTFVAFAIARLSHGSLSLPPLVLLGSFWLVPVAYGLSTLFSGVSFDHALLGVEMEVDTLGFVTLLAVLATLGAFVFREVKEYKRFFTLFVGAISLAFVAQIGIIIASKTMSTLPASTNLVGSFTDFSIVTGAGMILALLSLRFLRLSALLRIGLYVFMVLGFLVLVIANSNTVFVLVGLISGALFIEAVLARKLPEQMHLTSTGGNPHARLGSVGHGAKLILPLLCLIVSLFFVFVDVEKQDKVNLSGGFANTLGISIIDVRPSWQSTFMVGSHTFAASPLFGSGPNTFQEEWLKFKDRALNDTVFWNIDFASGVGTIPTSFITTGVIGALAWLLFLGVFLLTGFRVLMFKTPEDEFTRFTAIASFTMTAYLLLLAFFATPGPVVLALAFILLGVFISTLRFSRGRRESTLVFSESPRLGFVLVFVLTLLMLGTIAVTYKLTERYVSNLAFSEAVNALSEGNVDSADLAAGRSIALAPSERAYRLVSTIGIERMSRIVNDRSLEPTAAQQQFQAALSNSISAALEATRRGPTDYQNWTVLGNVYRSVAQLNVDGAFQGAKDAYMKAQELHPTSPVIPYILAQLELSQKHNDEAEAQALASVNLKRDYIPAILFLSQLEIQLGKASEALQAAEAAAYFAPNDSAVLLQVGLLRSGTGDRQGAITALSKAVELSPQYANARFFLAAMLANGGDLAGAIKELEAIASFSAENATAVASDLDTLRSGKNPFTTARLRSLGVPQPPVSEPTESTVE